MLSHERRRTWLIWLWVLLALWSSACTKGARRAETPLPGPTAVSADAVVTVDARQVRGTLPHGLWGTNLTSQAPAAETVDDPTFVQAARQLGITVVRWPGGNNADAYDWKRNENIRPGRRLPATDRVDLLRLIQFTRALGAEPSITVNFGTMSAQDAADLVAFLNGPADTPWGAQRAALGYPEPLNVRYFEIGNEENQPHMWYYAWTAENPEKYFFGGEEERRGFYDNSSSQEYDPIGAKGDLFKANGDPNQTYTLRFPPVREVRVWWAASRQEAESRQLEEWKPVDDLNDQPADAHVYILDEATGTLRFGDGTHGAIPPAESFFLVEYTTYDHDGFLAFARAMRAAPSSVPIQIGAAVLPFRDGEPIANADQMREIFAAMDFYVRHQYGASFDKKGWATYAGRRQIASGRVAFLQAIHQRVTDYLTSIGAEAPPAIAITEWNIFLDKRFWTINRTLEGGVIAAEWFIRLLNDVNETVPVLYANQFALHGGNLALIRSQRDDAIAPIGHVFQGFSDWPGSQLVATEVISPEALAYDQRVPLVAAAAAMSPDRHTLRIALVNNAETESLRVALHLEGFTITGGQMQRLAADDYTANNDRSPDVVTLRSKPLPPSLDALSLPPHSVTFLVLTGQTEAPRP